MSNRRLRFSPLARRNIKSIGRYTEDMWGSAKRDAYLGRLFGTFDSLLHFPHSGVARDEIHPGLRSLPIESHVVYYHVRDDGIYIAAILHENMEPSLHL